MREAVDVDFAEAADVAQRRERVVRQAPGTYLPSVTPLAAPPTQTWATGSEAVSSVPQRAPRTAAPPQTSVTVIEDSGTARAPAEGPQSPGDPGAPAPSD